MLIGDRDELRQKIDEDIAALYQRIRSLHAARNMLAPVNSLPLELLGRIFLLVRDSSSGRSQLSKGYVSWLRVTQVSQHWRQVAVEDSSLWTVLPGPFANENLLQLFMDRSKARLISVYMRTTKKNIKFFRSILLLKHLPRIRSLSISTCLEYWKKIVKPLCSPALELKELELLGQGEILENFPWPQDFLGENAPHLWRLSITEFPFLGYRPAFHGLTYLALRESIGRTRLVLFLGALDQMPNLKTLTITDSRDGETGDDEDLSSLALPIILPQLEHVFLHFSDFEWSIKFLNSLRFAKSPYLALNVRSDELETTPNAFGRLLPVFKAAYQHGLPQFSRMRLGTYDVEFQLTTWDTQGRLTFSIGLSCEDEDSDLEAQIQDWFNTCHDLALDSLDSLELYGRASSGFLTEFNELQHLKHITVEREDENGALIEFLLQNFEWHCDETKGSMNSEDEEDPEFLEMLHIDTCTEGDSWDNITFPKLETITMRSSTYESTNHEYWMHALRARRGHEYGPKKIILEDCDGITEEEVRDLQSLVEVEWDDE